MKHDVHQVQRGKGGKWRVWIGPAIMLLCLFLIAQLTLNVDPGALLNKTYSQTQAGVVPDAHYRITLRGSTAIALFVVLLITFVFSLRTWARYYLNRKLVLSYLFFAFIPLVCNAVIFIMGIRALFGILSVNTVENTMVLLARDLSKFSKAIQEQSWEILMSQDPQDFEIQLAQNINVSRETEMSRHRYSDILVDVYYLAPGVDPESAITCLHCDTLVREKIMQTKAGVVPSGVYSDLFPSWLKQENHMGMVRRGDRVFIQNYSEKEYAFYGKIVVVAAIPVDKRFVELIRETLDINITLAHIRGYWSIQTDDQPGSWFLRLLFSPLRSHWEIRALDWKTGQYHPTANMTFEIAPQSLIASFSRIRALHFFGQDQKGLQFYIILITTFFLVFGELIAFVFGIYLVSYITRSLNLIAGGHEQVANGNLDFRLPFLGKDQLGSMGRSFNSMVNSIESLLSQVREKEKYQEELRIARDIQMSLLPDLTCLPFSHDIAAACIPATDVGGDYFDIIQTECGEIGIFIADVSGKGTSAAFYMAELKGVLIALRHLWRSPKQLMLEVNEILFPALSSNVFISAAYLLLDLRMKRGRLARAGHCPAICLHRDGSLQHLLPAGMAIGLARNDVFGKIIEIAEFDLAPNDKIIMFTDGLEEMSFNGELYGLKRLTDMLPSHAGDSTNTLKDAILQDVLSFLSSGIQNDDLTLVVAGIPDGRGDVGASSPSAQPDAPMDSTSDKSPNGGVP